MVVSSLEKLKNELDIKYKELSLVLVAIIRRINEILPPVSDFEDTEIIIVDKWYKEEVFKSRYIWLKYCIVNNKLMLKGPDMYYDPLATIVDLSQRRKYNALYKLSERLPVFLKMVIEKAEQEGRKLDKTLIKLKKILEALE